MDDEFDFIIPEPEPIPDNNLYLCMCLRSQHNQAYKRWQLADLQIYCENNKQDKFMQFLITPEQKNKLATEFLTKNLYIDAVRIATETSFDGWALEEISDEIKDIRFIPQWYDFVLEEEK